MLPYELKKVYIKQYFLFFAILCVVLKGLSFFGLQESNENFTVQDHSLFAALIDQVGGPLTTENEEQIQAALNQLYDAEKSAEQLYTRLLAGEYADTASYSLEYAKLLPILEQKTALTALNDEYLYASQDRAQRWILSASLPVMETNTVDFLLLIFVLLVPVLVFYQEENTKMIAVIKTNQSGCKSTVYAKMLVVVISVIIMCLLFFSLDFLFCMRALQKGELQAPIQSLRFFSNSPCSITIIEGYWKISAIKTLGYLFLAVFAAALVVKLKNQVIPFLTLLSIYIIEPFALSDKNILYYTPFSLIKATGFFRGNAYIAENQGDNMVQDFVEISIAQQTTMILIGVFILCLSALFCYRSYCPGRKKIRGSILLLCICFLPGCSSNPNMVEFPINLRSSDVLIQNDTAYFMTEQLNIRMIDKTNGEETNTLRDPFLPEAANIKAIACTSGSLYYLLSTPLSNDIYQIHFNSFNQQNVFSQQLSDTEAFLGLSKKDMSFGIDGIKKMFTYNNNLYFITNNSDQLYCYNEQNKKLTTALSDGIFRDNLSVVNGQIHYINSLLELKSYDLKTNETTVISDIPCRSLYMYGNSLVFSGSSGIYRIDDRSHTTKLSEKGSDNIAFDGENLFYTDQNGVLYMVNTAGEELSLCENVAQFEVVSSNQSVVYSYIVDDQAKKQVLKY